MTLTAATLGARNTAPGILVQLGASLRLSSRGPVTVLGYDWDAADVRLTSMPADGTGSRSIAIEIADDDSAWPALILAGVDADMACRVWIIYVDATGSLEYQAEFDGVVRVATMQAQGDLQTVRIEAVGEGPNVAWTPRIAWQSDYAVRKGTEVTINNETFRLE